MSVNVRCHESIGEPINVFINEAISLAENINECKMPSIHTDVLYGLFRSLHPNMSRVRMIDWCDNRYITYSIDGEHHTINSDNNFSGCIMAMLCIGEETKCRFYRPMVHEKATAFFTRIAQDIEKYRVSTHKLTLVV